MSNSINIIMKRKTTEEFIEESIEVHGDKYSYSLSEYFGCNEKIIIVCPTHGEFKKTPSNHLRGQGCPQCSLNEISKRFSKGKEKFVSNSIDKHGKRYGYSLVGYVNCDTEVKIICQIHGIFLQKPYYHENGSGCPNCVKNKKDDNNSFIKKSIKIHKKYYNYEYVEIVNGVTKVKIECPIHGIFFQTPHTHISGAGCPKCFGNLPLTNNEFEFRSREIHGNKYIYTKVEYVNAINKVIIICPIHGDFLQSPNSHFNGSGCPKCNSSKGESQIMKWLDVNSFDYTREKTLKGCKHKRLLRFDFYLSELNICIEFDGEQHYRPINFTGNMTEEKTHELYNSVLLRDKIKTDYCHTNNIKLIRIPYTELKNIEKILNRELK